MSKLIQMPCKGGNIVVEVETAEDEIVPVGKRGEKIVTEIQDSFESLEGIIVDSCAVLAGAMSKLAEKESSLETASLELGFQMTGEGSIYLVKTAAQGSIKVTLNLKLR